MSRFLWLLLFSVAPTEAALPPEAQMLLATLPDKRVTLPLVLSEGMKHSDSFAGLKANRVSIEAPLLAARAPLDVRGYLKGSRLSDKREPVISFNPNRIEGTLFAVGAQTLFPTGTALSAEMSFGYQDIGFAALPASNFHETRGTLSLTQDLWRDAFGRATRAGLEAGLLSSQAAHAFFQEGIEDWTDAVVGLFYQSWLAQAQARAAKTSVERRNRLLKMIRLRVQRGTSETPDALQVESSALQAETAEARAVQTLGNRWRELVTALKFPEAWLKIDPAEIPLSLDEPLAGAAKSCLLESVDGSTSSHPPIETTATRRQELTYRAAVLSDERAKDALRPDLKLGVSFFGNGVASDQSTSLSEAAGIRHPGWSVGLTLSVPFFHYAEQAEAQMSGAELLRQEASLKMAKSQLKLDWLNACTNLESLRNSHERLKRAHENQLKRAKLEEDRYQVGRSTTFQLIAAEDDATTSEIQLQNSEIELRMASWKVRRLSNGYESYLTALGLRGWRAEDPTP